MTKEDKFLDIYSSKSDSIRGEKFEYLSQEQQREYRLWASQRMASHDKKIRIVKRIAIFLAILILQNGFLYFTQKKALRDQITSAFKQHACAHGLQVDHQWFSTADALTDYVWSRYKRINFYVVYTTISVDNYEYYYHLTGY